MIGLDKIREAAVQISDVIHRTPVMTSSGLNEQTGNDIFLKGEHLQKTGSFKIRGASNKVLKAVREGGRHMVPHLQAIMARRSLTLPVNRESGRPSWCLKTHLRLKWQQSNHTGDTWSDAASHRRSGYRKHSGLPVKPAGFLSRHTMIPILSPGRGQQAWKFWRRFPVVKQLSSRSEEEDLQPESFVLSNR